MKNLYLDTCCFNRPFDDQTQPRIRLESEAVKTILRLYEQKYWQVSISQATLFEVNNIPNLSRKQKIKAIVHHIYAIIEINDAIIQRAGYFTSCGLDAMDATHLASAENHADILLTVDDKFIKKAKLIEDLNIKAENPLIWLGTLFYEFS
jgi:predicted nucleic acid-binding protein